MSENKSPLGKYFGLSKSTVAAKGFDRTVIIQLCLVFEEISRGLK